ncbi:MAG: (d)CMP kinase [Gammaproteobacteria bacterium]|nr:(d)CMP kinase [Gammaproteobacteria bacterium]
MDNLKVIPVLTIDGPSGVGKGSVARIVAEKMGWHLLDSGAIYRGFALAALSRGINLADEQSLAAHAEKLDLRFESIEGQELLNVYVDGVEVSKELRTERTAEIASQLAVIAPLRAALLKKQQQFEQAPGLVADGRDMGTVVFPNAIYKIYLTASAEERAQRRLKQLQNSVDAGNISQILAEVKKRDERDANRKHSPLTPAKDALIIDTTCLTIDEVITRVMALVEV